MSSSAWGTTRLRYEAKLNPPASRARLLDPSTEVTFMAMESLHEDGTVELDVKREIGDVATSYSAFETGDVIVAKVTPCFENGKAALAPDMVHGVAFGTTEITVLRASAGMVPEFLYYVVTEDRFRQMGVASMTGAGGLRRVPDRFVRDYSFRSPPLDEQRQIAEYLDRETGKIDELITKQEQLVKRLIERRSAQVYSAVTSGLDAGVGHRDSGYSEIGQTPLHWETRQLKHIIRSQKSGTSVLAADTPAGAGQVGVLKTSSVSTGMFKSGENKTVSDEELSRVTCPIRVGTILINRANSPAYVGAAAFVENSEPNLFLSDKLWQIDVHGCDAQFISWWMQTKRYRDQVGFHVVGASSSMQNLSYEAFRGIRLALPPLQEQIAIAAFLIIAISKIDDLVQKVAQTAGVLRERRAALISAAVTGKIDLRSPRPEGALS